MRQSLALAELFTINFDWHWLSQVCTGKYKCCLTFCLQEGGGRGRWNWLKCCKLNQLCYRMKNSNEEGVSISTSFMMQGRWRKTERRIKHLIVWLRVSGELGKAWGNLGVDSLNIYIKQTLRNSFSLGKLFIVLFF